MTMPRTEGFGMMPRARTLTGYCRHGAMHGQGRASHFPATALRHHVPATSRADSGHRRCALQPAGRFLAFNTIS